MKLRLQLGITLLAVAAAVAVASADERHKGRTFGPRLLQYPLTCHEKNGCEVACFQAGIKIVSRNNISPDDRVVLIVGAGVSDEIAPRWLEIQAGDRTHAQTILLTQDTACDLQSLTINPLQLKP